MVSKASVAAAGFLAAANRAPSARAITPAKLCATMSCISRAMRLRSTAPAISARSISSCWSSRFLRSLVPRRKKKPMTGHAIITTEAKDTRGSICAPSSPKSICLKIRLPKCCAHTEKRVPTPIQAIHTRRMRFGECAPMRKTQYAKGKVWTLLNAAKGVKRHRVKTIAIAPIAFSFNLGCSHNANGRTTQ